MFLLLTRSSSRQRAGGAHGGYRAAPAGSRQHQSLSRSSQRCNQGNRLGGHAYCIGLVWFHFIAQDVLRHRQGSTLTEVAVGSAAAAEGFA